MNIIEKWEIDNEYLLEKSDELFKDFKHLIVKFYSDCRACNISRNKTIKALFFVIEDLLTQLHYKNIVKM